MFNLFLALRDITCTDYELKYYPPKADAGKPWSRCSLDEMCAALEKYGEAVAKEILSFGVRVNVWDIGNETNYGFAGVNVGLPNAVSPKAAKNPCGRCTPIPAPLS